MSHEAKVRYCPIYVLGRLGYNKYDAEREISHCILRYNLKIQDLGAATSREIIDLLDCLSREKVVCLGQYLTLDAIDEVEKLLLEYLILSAELIVNAYY